MSLHCMTNHIAKQARKALARCTLSVMVVTLMLPAAAGATIVVNRGMFGVSVGETMKQAQANLGTAPDTFRDGGRVLWRYPGRRLWLGFSGRRMLLHFLETTNRGQRTARGVGIGSREQDVARLVPGSECGTTPGFPGIDCFAFSRGGGKTVGTDFTIGPHGRVDDVSIVWLR